MSGHFLPIDPDECRRLIADAGVGRIIWASARGLQALPVNYMIHDDAILFRVAEGSILAELAAPRDASFQVDDVDVVTQNGWSVLMHGTTRRFDGDPDLGARLPWAPGPRGLGILFTAHTYSGRSVSAD